MGNWDRYILIAHYHNIFPVAGGVNAQHPQFIEELLAFHQAHEEWMAKKQLKP